MIYECYFNDEENGGPPTLSAAHSSTITTQRATYAKDSSSEISPEHNDQSEGENNNDDADDDDSETEDYAAHKIEHGPKVFNVERPMGGSEIVINQEAYLHDNLSVICLVSKSILAET
jgi:hypothetical protein